MLTVFERMWGGADAKQLTVPPELMYYLVTYATYAYHIPEDVRGGAGAVDIRCPRWRLPKRRNVGDGLFLGIG